MRNKKRQKKTRVSRDIKEEKERRATAAVDGRQEGEEEGRQKLIIRCPNSGPHYLKSDHIKGTKRSHTCTMMIG